MNVQFAYLRHKKEAATFSFVVYFSPGKVSRSDKKPCPSVVALARTETNTTPEVPPGSWPSSSSSPLLIQNPSGGGGSMYYATDQSQVSNSPHYPENFPSLFFPRSFIIRIIPGGFVQMSSGRTRRASKYGK